MSVFKTDAVPVEPLQHKADALRIEQRFTVLETVVIAFTLCIHIKMLVGFEPTYLDLQSSASPLGHTIINAWRRIRTSEAVTLTRFPGGRLNPLGYPSINNFFKQPRKESNL